MIYKRLFIVVLFLLGMSGLVAAQNQQLFQSQQFRLGERIIRIAEQGQIADSINVWGDVGSPGRYLVPKGTTLTKLLSYSFGPRTLNETQTQVDWSKMRVEINVQEYDELSGMQTITKFQYRFEEALPNGMNNFILRNNQTIGIRVKRKPGFRDYVQVIAPVISAVATTITTAILISDRRNN